jgi:hypothetical protein
MTFDVRQAIEDLKITLTPFGTGDLTAQTAPVDPYFVNVATTNPPIGLGYVLIESYTYPSYYQVSGVKETEFLIATPYISDELTKSLTDVTGLVNAYNAAVKFLSQVPCMVGSTNFDLVAYYYALYTFSQDADSGIKKIAIRNQYSAEAFGSSDGTPYNAFFEKADKYSGGCLSSLKDLPFLEVLNARDFNYGCW